MSELSSKALTRDNEKKSLEWFIQMIQKESIIPFLLASLIFVLPLSPSLKSLFSIVTIALMLSLTNYRRRFVSILSQNISIAAILLFGVSLLACFWSVTHFTQALDAAEKYLKVMYIPLFAVGFSQRKTRHLVIHVFLFACFIPCFLSIFKHAGILTFNSTDPGQIFFNHIVTSFMTAFAAYIAAIYAQKKHGTQRLGYIALMLFFTYQILFINTGRTGHVLYFILLGVLLILGIQSNRNLFVLLSFSVVVSGVAVTVPSEFSLGIHNAIQDLRQYKNDKDTSVGYRLQFHQYAKSLFLSKPLIGYGTGGFKTQFKHDNPIPQRGNKLNEPHSQYWLVASEFGLLGLLALLYFLISVALLIARLHEMKPILLGLLIAFVFANLTDSLLINTGIGYLFVMFCAMGLGEDLQRRHIISHL